MVVIRFIALNPSIFTLLNTAIKGSKDAAALYISYENHLVEDSSGKKYQDMKAEFAQKFLWRPVLESV